MYLSEAIKAMEMNLRSTCMMLEAVRNNQVDKAIDYDWLPMQDHLALCIPTITISEESSVEDCLKYLGQLYKGLTKAMAHYKKGNRVLGVLECEEAYMIDMLYGFIGHQFNEDYVKCARECVKAYNQTPINPNEEKNDENFIKWRRTVLNKFNEILKKYKIDITNKGEWSIRVGYLEEWLGRKYWKD
jgi:hypothetical protein